MELGEPIEGDMIQARVYVCGHRLHRAWNMLEACLGEKGKERCDWQTEMGERKKCITSRPLDQWRAAWEMCLWDGYSGSWVSVTQQMRLKTRE